VTIGNLFTVGAFSGMLEEASKRTGKYTKRKMREQYEVAQVSRVHLSLVAVAFLLHAHEPMIDSLFSQRNVTAKSYINSVAKIMGVDLTPFRD
jgi:hypothetical protein